MDYRRFSLFCDLEKVLLNSRKEPSQEDREAIERFVGNGGLFGVIAEFSPCTVRPLLHNVPTNTWSVVLGGAEAYRFDNRTVAFPRVLSQLSMAAFLRQVMDDLEDVSILLYSESRLFCLTDPALLDQRLPHGKPPYDVVGLETALRFPWLGVRFFGPVESLRALEQAATSWGIYDLAYCIHDDPSTSYFVPHGTSKSRCIGDIRHQEDVRARKMVILGSRSSDVELLSLADISVAAPNAAPNVKEAASYRIPDTETDPLRYLIDELLPTL